MEYIGANVMMDQKNHINSDEEQKGRQHGSPLEKKRRGKRTLDFFIILVIICCIVFLCIPLYNNWLARWQMGRIRESKKQFAFMEMLANNGTVTDKEEDSDTEETADSYGESAEYLSPINFEELRRINPDVVAWLVIPGTSIDYPVVQTTDNEIYLKKTFEGGSSAAGTIFLDYESRRDLAGFHNIVYGHHMKNQTMFTDLIKFKEEEFFKEHREIILYTPEKELHLETVAALYGDAGGENRRTNFSSQEKFNEYVDAQTKDCSFRELPEGDIEHLYSFVTCSYEFEDARTILYAVDREN